MAHSILALGWLLFGLIHSLTASVTFKEFIKKRNPKLLRYYRLSYNMLATLTFILVLFYQVRIEKVRLWPPSLALTVLGGGLAGIGLGIVLLALRQYDMREFTGLDAANPSTRKKGTLQVNGISGLVRHPLYTGTLLLLWGFWLLDSSLSSLIMAVSLSLYIRIGIYFEEKKLLREFGEDYARYRQRVPMLFPSFF